MIEDNTPASGKQTDFMRKLHIEPWIGITKFQAKNAIDKGIAERDAKKAGQLPQIPQEEEIPVVRPGSVPEKVVQTDPDYKKSYYVSYAKDIFCCLTEHGGDASKLSFEEMQIGMDMSIKLVKQAMEAF